MAIHFAQSRAITLGYVPVDDEGTWDGTVSTSLEYYVADFALGKLAQALGDEQAAQIPSQIKSYHTL